MAKYEVVAICNALMDLLVEVDDDFIKRSELTKGVMHLVDGVRQKSLLAQLSDHKVTHSLGGSSLNAIRSIAHLGAKTAFIGKVGEDEFADKITEKMKELDVDRGLSFSNSEPTGTCLILVTPDGERTMNTCLGASRLYDQHDLDFDLIKDTKVLHFCGYQWDTENQKDAIRKAISVAKNNNAKISFDVADPFVVDRNKDEFRSMISESADIVFANQKEAEMLYDCGPEEAANRIAAEGAIAVVKCGAEGAIVKEGDKVSRVEAVKTNVIDTTAAGDMFAAGFLYGFVKGKDNTTSAKMAANLASCVISRIGTHILPETYERVKSM